jgi:D-amino peptidase
MFGRMAGILMAGMLAAEPLAAQAPFKVFISVDMEGLAGVVTPEQLGPAGFEYQRFREFMTLEALAAVEGAREAGATDIVVADAHGNGQNLLIERFPPDVILIRSWPRPLGMMEGIDASFDAAVFLGYHSGATNPEGVRAHTFSSANYAGVRLNGRDVPESGWNAAIAGHFGVPVVLIAGDDASTAELAAFVPGVEQVVVKRAISFHAAATMTPAAAQELIRARVRQALLRRAAIRPWVQPGPVTVDVTFKNYLPAVVAAYHPSFVRAGSHTVRFQAADMPEASRIMQFLGTYQAGLAP